MADLDNRLSPSCLDIEDEALDPRIQDELEQLNKASEEINRLELELDDARAAFRQALSDTTQKLDFLSRKLGSCVEKARPYYDSRVRAKDVHVETQKAAYMYERACSMHEAAKEMVQVAEQGYMQREEACDQAWQEMLNHATMKVNDAERERLESEKVHRRTTQSFKDAEDSVQKLQKNLKRAINKSKPYFEMKAKFNQMMEDQKRQVLQLESKVTTTKSSYSAALRSLEEISEGIHRHRIEMKNQAELGIREAGVGSESPSPPPMRGKDPLSIDGTKTQLTSSCSASLTTVTSSQASDVLLVARDFRPSSIIYSSPEKARSQSYRDAIEARNSEESREGYVSLNDIDENFCVNVDEDYLSLPNTAVFGGRDRSSSDSTPKAEKAPSATWQGEQLRRVSAPLDISRASVGEITPTQDKLSTSSGELTPVSGSPAVKGKKPAKLKGLILTPVGAGLDPLNVQMRNLTDNSYIMRRKSDSQVQTRPVTYPYSHDASVNSQYPVHHSLSSASHAENSKAGKSNVDTKPSPLTTVIETPTDTPRRLLKVPSMQDFDESSMSEISDTESIASATMLDDDQVELLTLSFHNDNTEDLDDRTTERHNWNRMSLPPNLSHLESFITKLSIDKLSPRTEEAEDIVSPNATEDGTTFVDPLYVNSADESTHL